MMFYQNNDPIHTVFKVCKPVQNIKLIFLIMFTAQYTTALYKHLEIN